MLSRSCSCRMAFPLSTLVRNSTTVEELILQTVRPLGSQAIQPLLSCTSILEPPTRSESWLFPLTPATSQRKYAVTKTIHWSVNANTSVECTILPRQSYTSYEEGIQCLTSNHSAIELWIIWKLLHIVIEWKRIFIRHQADGDVHLHICDS